MARRQVAVVLPGAGSGVRMGASTPKQFLEVLGAPVLVHTIQSFKQIPWIDDIILVVAEDKVEVTQKILQAHGIGKVILTAGGKTRFRSIASGVRRCTSLSPTPDVVVVHDVVRPFIDQDTLLKVVEAAEEFGASGVVVPLISTVLNVTDDDFMAKAFDRSRCVSSEMPQAFRSEVIRRAFEKCTEHDFENGTECLHIAHVYGGASKVKLVRGSPEIHWKVTFPQHLKQAEDSLRNLRETWHPEESPTSV